MKTRFVRALLGAGSVLSLQLLVSAHAAASTVPAPRLAPDRVSASIDAPVSAGPVSTRVFDPGRTGFQLFLPGGLTVDYEVFTWFVRPGEQISLQTSLPVSWHQGEGVLAANTLRYRYTAPDMPGLHVLTLQEANGERLTLNLLVMHEAEDGAVNGYALGDYPAEPYRGEAVYEAPTHFAAVTPELARLPVSPHFTLGQFLCKQAGSQTPHLVLSPRLLAKLELILEHANTRGWTADTLTVMSGFRTPLYNAGIGNGRYSRHIYGGAADVFIDFDGNGRMDDLNRDGRVDRQDAAALYDLVEQLAATPNFAPYLGGLGEYGSNSVRGPFVHVDERGWRARWGRPHS